MPPVLRWLAHACLSMMLLVTYGEAKAETKGRLRVLTYNVAGLPDGFTMPHPSANMARIGELLNGYDLALIQEDFAYPSELRRLIELPYGSAAFARGQRLHFGDGLSQFSVRPFFDLQREAWQQCNGIMDSFHDCLTPKGFSWSRQPLTAGVDVHVYNVHLDAGWSAPDSAAREAQVTQLIAAIQRNSAGKALIVGGDTNIPARQRALLRRLQKEAGLTDACEALRCAQPWRVDRVLFRSSERVRWTARRWATDRRFVDSAQRALSDHLAVAVDLDWST